jgi:hypothetical protein
MSKLLIRTGDRLVGAMTRSPELRDYLLALFNMCTRIGAVPCIYSVELFKGERARIKCIAVYIDTDTMRAAVTPLTTPGYGDSFVFLIAPPGTDFKRAARMPNTLLPITLALPKTNDYSATAERLTETLRPAVSCKAHRERGICTELRFCFDVLRNGRIRLTVAPVETHGSCEGGGFVMVDAAAQNK